MSLKHAANRFLRTPIDGWDGTQWLPNITQGNMLTGDRFISDREFGNKLRNLLVDPDKPIPPGISLIRIGPPTNVYMVGRSSYDIFGSVYSMVVSLRRAYYTCTVETFVSQTAASGAKTGSVRSTVGHFACDHENITFTGSRDFPTIKYGDEVVILPAGTPVDTTNEIAIGNNFYEVQEIYDYAGLQYCRCIVKRTPRIDIAWAGSAQASAEARGKLSNDLYRHPFSGDVAADSVANGTVVSDPSVAGDALTDSTLTGGTS